jgi:ATP-dependent Lhr-like helicase
VEIDYVGSPANAAKIIAGLHRGEKRLVFAESRAGVETLANSLRDLEVETYVSHSSLALDERRRAEAAFAEARDCVIVSTSTLELGIDVGDLDRVIQIGAPQTVASFLQRLGRTGRRPGSQPNTLFLATTDDELVIAAGLTLLWGEGFVEPVAPPPHPRQLAAQQLLALALQRHQVGRTWPTVFDGIELCAPAEYGEITDWMLSSGHLDTDSGMVFVGPQAERRYGHRHFMELLSIFAAPPEFTVVHGRHEIGTVDPFVLIRKVAGPRRIALAGRSWTVSAIDWSRRRTYVEPAESGGAARWISVGQPQSYAFVDAQRRVLLGADPTGATLSRRAREQLTRARREWADRVDRDHTMIRTDGSRTRWWTWAGGRANAILTAALETVDRTLVDDDYVYDNRQIGLRTSVTEAELRRAVHAVQAQLDCGLDELRPFVTEQALQQLKFADLLPPALALRTLEERLSDPVSASVVLARPIATAPAGRS